MNWTKFKTEKPELFTRFRDYMETRDINFDVVLGEFYIYDSKRHRFAFKFYLADEMLYGYVVSFVGQNLVMWSTPQTIEELFDLVDKPVEVELAINPAPVKEIVRRYLDENGYDGLYNPDEDCGCEYGCQWRYDLMPCSKHNYGFAKCFPGYSVMRGDGDHVIVKDKQEVKS